MLVRLMGRRHVVTSQTYEVDKRKLRNPPWIRTLLPDDCGCWVAAQAARSRIERVDQPADAALIEERCDERELAVGGPVHRPLWQNRRYWCDNPKPGPRKITRVSLGITGKSSVRALMGAQTTSLPQPSTADHRCDAGTCLRPQRCRS
jgi:hypothetical protein